MEHVRAAAELSKALSLGAPPVALARADRAPSGVATLSESVPSACALWRRAETRVFYAPAALHFRCPIGAHVMGFELPPERAQELMSLVGFMASEGYVGEAEVAQIPTFGTRALGAVYGPLAAFPVTPEFVLLWLSPRQAMIATEATGASRWTAPAPQAVFGRPACAALPASEGRGAFTLSLGCTGMRTYTEISDDRLLGVVPAASLASFLAAVAAATQANGVMAEFYERRKAAVT